MKKMILALFVVVFGGSVCLAGEAPAQSEDADTSEETGTGVKTESFTGKIDAIWEANINGITKPCLSVRDDAGHPVPFTVAKDAVIIGGDGKPTTLSWVKGNDVSLSWVLDDDGRTKKVTSIRVSRE